MKQIRYFLEACVAYLFYGVFRLLPMKWASAVAGKLARYVGPKLSLSQKVADKNLQRAMPELTAEDRQRIIADMWENLGRVIGEFPHLGGMSAEKYHHLVDVKGEEILPEFLASDKPAIFIAAHLGNWEFAPKTAAVYGAPLALVYRPANNPYVEKLIHFVRRHYQTKPIAKGVTGARQILSELKAGRPIGMLVDQKMNDGIAVPFFGRDAMTAPALATLARKFKCPVIPAQIIRKGGGRFETVVHTPIYVSQSDNAEQDIYDFMLTVNQMIEGWIRENPAQWFWVHNRWPKA